MFIKIHNTLVNKTYIHSIHPVDKEQDAWVINIDYITFVQQLVDNNVITYKTIKSRKYKYTTKEEAEDQFNKLSSLLLPQLEVNHDI